MAGDKAPSASEFERLQARFNKLAEDKSYYQLILRLTELLDPLPGLEDMLRRMLLNIVECIGGTNVKVYYWIEDELHYMDFLGEQRVLPAIDDDTVAQAARSREFIEQRGDAEAALLMHGMLRGSWTWTFPLLVGDQLIGIVKLENLHIHGASLGRYLPIFFSHVALILGNEIRNSIHRRSEEALQVATERLKLATEAGLIGIWDWDIPHDQLVWDDAMYRLYGLQPGDFGGAYQAWLAAVHPQDKPLADGEIQAALRGEREYEPEFRVIWPDGSIHYIKAASRTLRDADGKPLRMVGINYDLTERRRSEERLGRLNRELRAISDCNQALIRADDEASLLDKVCRIICDQAGYRLAWVGLAEQDAAKSVRPVAWAGADDGYLAAAAFTWGEGGRGQGAVGCAIRDGVTALIQDFARDPAALPWREAALARDFRSCVALPLRDQERQVFGVLCIYAAEVEAFTPDELRLLEELAGDLAFGIVVLRTRARRDQAEANLAASERRFRSLVENLPDLVVRYDTALRRTYVNPEWERLSGLTAADVLGMPAATIPRVPQPLADDYLAALHAALQTGTRQSVDFSWVNARGEMLHLEYVVVPEFDDDGRVVGLLAVGRDLGERKRAEEARLAHLRFLEGLDRVNRAIQGAANLDQMMADALAVVLEIFDCDRAFLLYPCDPQAPAWRVPMECTRPEFPGVLALGAEVPTSADVAETFRSLLAAHGPVRFGPGTDHPLPADAAERFGFKSILSMAIRPKTGSPWQFGLHQCRQARQWTVEEERLFEEVGRRLADALGMLLILRDLEASERRFRLVFENSPVSIWEEDFSGVKALFDQLRARGVVDLGAHLDRHPEVLRQCAELARVVDVNEAAVRLHEARGKDELLAGLARTFTDESFAVFREELLRLWQGETAMVRDAVVRTLGGERRHVTVQFSVCSDYEETLGKVVVSLNDITERKRAEEELKQHRQHLEQLVDVRTRELAETRDAAESANRMKSIFLANMSHELRTPLNAILGFAHILERDPRLADDQRHKLATIGRSGHHLLSLINDVLEISRIEAGRISVQPSAFDLPAMLDSLRDFVELRAQAKGLELGLELAVSLPRYVRADAGKLRQILVNLLTNAVKYTEAGRIVLSASMRVEAGRTWLDFSVRDTGVGIAPAELESIFQPFHQTAYGAAVGEGTGLGLTISRQYAQLLGGQLTAESRLGAGSVFRLSLPAELAASPAPIPVTHGPVVGLVADQPRYRVLVVDDDADSRYLLEELLRQVEFQVRSAANGEEAVAAFQNWHPHFIWMDMRMPVMDGYEATRRIRAMPAGDQVRIAALTASAFLEDRAGMVAAGCDVVLAKPLDEIQLFATMEGLLGLRFRYADEEPDAGQGEADWDLSALPASLRAELATAARCLDAEAVAQVLVRIRELDARSAAGLQELIKDYRYDRVVSLCDENSVRQPT